MLVCTRIHWIFGSHYSFQRVSPDQTKIEAMLIGLFQFIKQRRGFLGPTGFYRRLPVIMLIAFALTDLDAFC